VHVVAKLLARLCYTPWALGCMSPPSGLHDLASGLITCRLCSPRLCAPASMAACMSNEEAARKGSALATRAQNDTSIAQVSLPLHVAAIKFGVGPLVSAKPARAATQHRHVRRSGCAGAE